MTTERERRRRRVRRAGASVGVLAALGMVVPAQAASTSDTQLASRRSCAVQSVVGGIVGSWDVRVLFPANSPIRPGAAEETMITFTPGGGMVEVNPLNPSQANHGAWRMRADCDYDARLVEFTYDPTTHGVRQIVNVDLVYQVAGDQLTTTSTNATITNYDPLTGQPRFDHDICMPAVVTIAHVTDSIGERFTTGWQSPDSMPTQPSPNPAVSC
jgi:hypothetical protein